MATRTALRRVLLPVRLRGRGIATKLPSVGGWAFDKHSDPRFGSYAVLDKASAMEVYPPPRFVPEEIRRPEHVPSNFFTAPIWEHDEVESTPATEGRIRLGTEEEDGVRAAGRLAGEVLRLAEGLVKPGVTTNEIDAAIHAMIVQRGAYPSPLGYSHYPRSCTTSVNNVIAHGIPDDRPLRPDDIINVDITLYYNGYHGDTSVTYVLTETDKAGRELVAATKEALELGIAACGPGKPFSGIGKVISEFAKEKGLSVNTQFCGHGIGAKFHGLPSILHHRNWEKGVMRPGDCFTIEPPLVQGSGGRGSLWEDGWTVSTDTGARSAQFEHQVLITETGVDVLTRRGKRRSPSA